MYSTGTVTTTANSTKLVGTGTKWLNNINRVSAEQAIQVQIGNTVHNNSIQSIQSDTELTLNFPFPTAAKDAKYVILTTMVHSVSDAMNKIVSMNGSNVQFSDILTRWMTEQGIITVTLPDQTTQQLRTTKEMDKQLDGKFDKAGGNLLGHLSAQKEVAVTHEDDMMSMKVMDKSRGPHFVSRRSSSGIFRTHSLQDSNGILMHVGDFGWGGAGPYKGDGTDEGFLSVAAELKSQVFRSSKANAYQHAYGSTLMLATGDSWGSICIQHTTGNVIVGAGLAGGISAKNTLYGTANTTKDSNGNLKAASPIVKIFADDIDVNEESEGVTLKKLHTGIYQLCGVLGMHSDASWGGVNGGITIPSGINQLPLIYVDYDVLVAGERHPFNGEIIRQDEHGDIVIYASYRKHLDLPQNVQYARLKTYPEFAREIDGKLVELEAGEPIDIPNGHWIDVRVNMPSNSLYNQKQAEAQRLAKIEAERLAKEEAEKAQRDK
ncbi:hypothetical protein C9446_11570 [Providencia heimbachae]|uniref:phage tail fiber protein n=1 Tax=Providencia heimbachae TaxID=333962 RepID=UPI0010BE2A21|nr:hypothetical protein [Providencia heimbachae]QCJ70435.1 hypothetical protein C9446_11570 [Providencia heimbachae]